MGVWEKIKGFVQIPDDDYDDEIEDVEEQEESKKKETSYESAPKRTESAPRIIGGGRKQTVPAGAGQMQVVLVKPDRFEDVPSIADHLNIKKTVILNLEAANREVSRRIIDFLSGAAYANGGNIRKVANSTFVIVPKDVDVMGEMMLEEFDEGKMYF